MGRNGAARATIDGMARLELRRDLDKLVAERFAAPHVERVTERIRDDARRRAPNAKRWVSMRDDRVRPTHVVADGQMVPANVPFRVPRPQILSGAVTGEVELAMRPRDPALSAANAANCRCAAPDVPEALRASIHATDVEVIGARARAEVYSEFPHAVESEHADTNGDWMGGALAAAARGEL